MKNKAFRYKLWHLIAFIGICTGSNNLTAQDHVPTTKGFNGYFAIPFGSSNIATNVVYEGSPLIGELSTKEVESIYTKAASQRVNLFGLSGELNYTFDSSRIQLFLGNRLEDLLRLDVNLSLGIRKELKDKSIIAFSVLTTPLLLKSYEDPYIEGVERTPTQLNVPGIRFRWGSMFKTGLEFTLTARKYTIYNEKSGEWLINQGSLESKYQHLLDRNGIGIYPQVIYRMDFNKHRFEPMLRYNYKNLEGHALSTNGYAIKLTYIFFNPKVFILDFNIKYESNQALEVHPVYGEKFSAQPIILGLGLIKAVKKMKSSVLNVFVAGEYYRQNTNIDFLNTDVSAIQFGIIWRHIKK